MKTPIKVEVILAFSNFKIGDVFEPAGILRDNLIQNGYVKILEEPAVEEDPPVQSKPTIETTSLPGSPETASLAPKVVRKKRGRPAKSKVTTVSTED